MRFLAFILSLLIAMPVEAQQCSPLEPLYQHHQWIFNTYTADGPVVPADQVWLIRTAGIVSNSTGPVGGDWPTEYSLQIKSVSPNGCCWFHPLTDSRRTSTPKLTLGGAWTVLVPGDFLGARTNWQHPSMSLMFSGWRFPVQCLPWAIEMAARHNAWLPEWKPEP